MGLWGKQGEKWYRVKEFYFDSREKHRQMTDEQLTAAGVGADLIRLSCGLENSEDLIADLQQAIEKV